MRIFSRLAARHVANMHRGTRHQGSAFHRCSHRQVRYNHGNQRGEKLTRKTFISLIAMVSLVLYVFMYVPLRWLATKIGLVSPQVDQLTEIEMTALKDDLRILDREIQNTSSRIDKTLKMYGITYIEKQNN